MSQDNQDLIAVNRVFTSCKAAQVSVDSSSGGRDAPLSLLLSHIKSSLEIAGVPSGLWVRLGGQRSEYTAKSNLGESSTSHRNVRSYVKGQLIKSRLEELILLYGFGITLL